VTDSSSRACSLPFEAWGLNPLVSSEKQSWKRKGKGQLSPLPFHALLALFSDVSLRLRMLLSRTERNQIEAENSLLAF
jgi:hypothetical protein